MSESRDGSVEGLNLVISLCLTYTLCIVLVRLWIRRGAFGYDDIVVYVATLFTLGHTATDYVALVEGLGKPWQEISDSKQLSSLNAATLAGIVTFTIALYLSKLSVVAFLCRITKNAAHIRLYAICSIVIAVFGVASVLTTTVDCSVDSGFYWAFMNNKCTQVPRWQAFTAFDVVTEILILALPLHMLWNLQMPVRKKAIVLIAFYLRAPVIALSIGRNHFTINMRSNSADPSLDGALIVIWFEVELAYALAANTLSALKAFTESFNSGFGQGFIRGREEYDLSKDSGTSGRLEKQNPRPGHSEDIALRQASSSSSSAKNGANVTSRPLSPRHYLNLDGPLKLRPENEGISTTRVSADPDRSWRHDNAGSRSDSPADDMIILRETELSIHHDQAPILRHAL